MKNVVIILCMVKDLNSIIVIRNGKFLSVSYDYDYILVNMLVV